MTGMSGYSKASASGHFHVSLAVECRFLQSAGTVCKRVGGAVHQKHVNALSALDIQRRPLCRGKVEVVQMELAFVHTVVGKRGIVAGSAQHKLHFFRGIGVVDDNMASLCRIGHTVSVVQIYCGLVVLKVYGNGAYHGYAVHIGCGVCAVANGNKAPALAVQDICHGHARTFSLLPNAHIALCRNRICRQ